MAATFTTIHTFPDQRLGSYPTGLLYQNGFLVGATSAAGPAGSGNLFKLELATGSVNVLYDFATPAEGGQAVDGVDPEIAPTSRGGALIGVTPFGGSGGYRTLYRLDVATRTETILHNFSGMPDGIVPSSRLLVINGAFYGTAGGGGDAQNGLIFKFDPVTNTLTTIYSFTGQADGGGPQGRLIYQDGCLFGVTGGGGATMGHKHGQGTVYKLDLATKALTVLYTFYLPNGDDPHDLTLHDHTLYGVAGGGKYNDGQTFSIDLNTGVEKVLYTFQGGDDGELPVTTPIFFRGVLYGTTPYGGPSGGGTLYSIDLSSGAKATVHNFTRGSDGAMPSDLIEHDGVLYGTTAIGGNQNCNKYGCGTVFSLAP